MWLFCLRVLARDGGSYSVVARSRMMRHSGCDAAWERTFCGSIVKRVSCPRRSDSSFTRDCMNRSDVAVMMNCLGLCDNAGGEKL